MQSDLTDLGILPRGGDDGQQLGIAPFADRGVMRGIATAARRDMAASRLAARGQMPNAARNFRGATNATNTGRNYIQEANNVVNNRNLRTGQRWAENAKNASRPAMGEASKAAAPDAYAGIEGTVIPYEGRLNGWGWPIGVAATLGTAGVGSYLYDEKTSGSGSPYLPQPAKSTSGKKNSWYIPGHRNAGTFKTEKEAQDYYNKNIRGKQAQAAPTSSSTPSTAASNTGSTRSAARRNAAPATNRAAQNTTQGRNKGDIVNYKYDWYRNGDDGTGTHWGFTPDENGIIDTTTGYTDDYRNLVSTLTADDIRKWAAEHPNDPSLQSFLANNGADALTNLTDDQWRRGATDGRYGFMHHVAAQIGANNSDLPIEENGARPITEADYTLTEDELNAAGNRIDEQSRAWTGSGNPVADAANAAAGQRTNVQGPPAYSTWMRYAPAVGAGLIIHTLINLKQLLTELAMLQISRLHILGTT